VLVASEFIIPNKNKMYVMYKLNIPKFTEIENGICVIII
jgi:hypothetical protein